jgi:hypothetical protein
MLGGETWRPILASSPQMRRWPQCGFSRASRETFELAADPFVYTNDQNKRPSLDHGKRDEPSEPEARESRGRVCEPYEW